MRCEICATICHVRRVARSDRMAICLCESEILVPTTTTMTMTMEELIVGLVFWGAEAG